MWWIWSYSASVSATMTFQTALKNKQNFYRGDDVKITYFASESVFSILEKWIESGEWTVVAQEIKFAIAQYQVNLFKWFSIRENHTTSEFVMVKKTLISIFL